MALPIKMKKQLSIDLNCDNVVVMIANYNIYLGNL